jgi:cytochrome c-type biogenesis protein CcmH
MILPFLLAALAFAALLLLVLPLLRPAPPAQVGGAFDRAVYRDQLRELDRDIARGLVTETEAQGTRLEIQRRILSTDVQESGPRRHGASGPSPVLAGLLAVLVLSGSLGLYLTLGDPGRPDMPFASRPPPSSDAIPDMRRVMVQLEARLAEDPNNADGWLLYARANMLLGQWDKAADASRRAIELGRTDMETLATHGEILVVRAQGTVTAPAREIFAAILKTDPGNQMARFYMALATGQSGDPAGAMALLQTLAGELPPQAPARAEIDRQIAAFARLAGIAVPPFPPGGQSRSNTQGMNAQGANAQGGNALGATPPGTSAPGGQSAPGSVPTASPLPAQSSPSPSKPVSATPTSPAAPGPDADAIAAASQMSEADRKVMIGAMVSRLADRLETNPDDLDGWLRLGRARTVLGERDKAADAYERAAVLQPTDLSIPLRAVEALLDGLAVTEALPVRAIGILRRIESIQPNEPAVLWYLGLAAAQGLKPEIARGYWTRLRAMLPPDSEDARMVGAAINALSPRLCHAIKAGLADPVQSCRAYGVQQ